MINDIEPPKELFDSITERLKLLFNRFIAIAMDYKENINPDFKERTVFELRDNIMFRLKSSQFHFQLLLEQHIRIERRLMELHKNNPLIFLNNAPELTALQFQSTNEIYSLFDSLIYHVCSIYDYLFRLINYTTGSEILQDCKWNKFRTEKNSKNFIYCNKEMHSILENLDANFVYPLYKHRSHLIHTENDSGNFKFSFKMSGTDIKAKFEATKLFMNGFPDLKDNPKFENMTIKYASYWIIDNSIIVITKILLELKNDFIRNKKAVQPFLVRIGNNGKIESISTPYWGDITKC